MTTKDFKRKLSAIFSADVAGYSRLMGEDEAATVEAITTYREIMGGLIRQHRGRVVDSPGDNILAEFASVVDAVQCAVAVQKEFQARNAELPENRRMEFRIGINLGDVIEEEERIYGDGVNIAARLESLADSGGICVSKTAFDHIETKLPLGYEYLGDQTVKNIAKPVGAYRVLMEPRVTVAGEVEKEKAVPVGRRKAILAGGVALILVVIAGLIWNYYFRPPPIEPASVEKMAFPLPEKPSIAVLPFKNLSGDSRQEYFSDGITEQIITGLSKVPKLFVIARNSSFAYKGKPMKIQKVAEDLGVRYVLEGSVQRSDSRIRITAQLIDALSGNHLWAERYDRDLKDIFALQDEITTKIMRAMRVKILGSSGVRSWGKSTDNIKAYETFLQGVYHFRRMNKADNSLARQLFDEAVSHDPRYAAPYVMLGWTHWHDVFLGSSKNPKQSLGKAFQAARKALALDDSLASAHGLLAFIYLQKRAHEKAVDEAERAVAIDPNSADALVELSFCLRYSGRSEEAVSLYEKALRLNPFPPSYYLHGSAVAYYLTGRYDEAIAACKRAITVEPESIWSHFGLSFVYSAVGRDEEAHVEAEEVLRINPKFSLEYLEKVLPYKNKADLARLIGDARKAGLPDKPPLPLPDKPSIAVLPFVNMSGDPEQEYFSDGITEEIITALSKTPKLFVIARNSTFTYKGKAVKVQQVGRDLGVRYVLEGSVRKSGDKVRITAQLVDAKTGHHLWAERYDRELKNIFAIQDEITKEITQAMQVKLTEGEQTRMWTKASPEVRELGWKGREYIQRFNKDGNTLAKRTAKEMMRLDPEFAGGYELLAWTHVFDINFGWSDNPKESLKKAVKFAKKSLALDNSIANSHSLMAYLHLIKHQYDEAIEEGERAVSLNPNAADCMATFGLILRWVGEPDKAVEQLKKAIRLNPQPLNYYFIGLGNAFRDMGLYDQAVIEFKKVIARNPNDLTARLGLASTYALAGLQEQARAEAEEVLRIHPKFSLERYTRGVHYKKRQDRERYLEALSKAGLK